MVAALILSAALAAAPAPDGFVCRVEGAKLARNLDAATICARFRAAIERRTGRRLAPLPAEGKGKRRFWRVEVRLAPPGIATARLTGFAEGRAKTWPERSIAVSDKGIDAGTIAMLAREVADQVPTT